jgi:hypothetical protein
MPATHRIDKERRLVITTGSGVLTLEEVTENTRRLRSDPEFDPTFNQLADYSATTKVLLTGRDIETVAKDGKFFAKRNGRRQR